MTTNRRILLARRPQGQVQEEDLRFVEEPLAPLQDGHVRFRNRYISLDPATRGWMDDKASYMQPIPIDGVMLSDGVAEVIEYKLDGWEKGDIVSALFGWEEYRKLKEQQYNMWRRADKYTLTLSYTI